VERRLPYEESLRIPLLVRYPRTVEAGRLIDDFALTIDLAPTALELAGVTSGPDLDGNSLVPLFAEDPPADWRTSFVVEYNTDTVFPRVHRMGYRAIRTERWKYIQYKDLEGMDELYDLVADPYEMKNRIGDSEVAAILKKLASQLDAGFSKGPSE
jgi:N-acetylglucosamine-6-sulfatase